MLLIAALVVCGMIVYLTRYIDHGKEWALYFSRANSGSTGQLIDRNGITLAYFNGTDSYLCPDRQTRIANYHVTGDYWGRTGTGILSRFWKEMQDFSLLTGTTRTEDSVLTLNIDARLNDRIFEALGNSRDGCMLVCNYRTGELLGMVSTPSVDPIDSNAEVRDGAFINRCLSASYTPGSIFKLVTASAAIDRIPNLEQRSFFCDKEYEIAGVPIICIASHYTQTFEQALANSCNIAFAQLAVQLGQDTMVEYVRRYGLIDRQSLDGIPTAAGSFPTEFVGDPELGWAGIGQSTDTVCPYAMLRLICAIANGGTLVEPHLIRSDAEPERTPLLQPQTAEKLISMMNYNAVSHYNAEEMFPGLKVCAKTGTAEIGNDLSHSWFVGFLADEDHPYAFVTLIERGGFGISAAGPVAADVMLWAVDNLES